MIFRRTKHDVAGALVAATAVAAPAAVVVLASSAALAVWVAFIVGAALAVALRSTAAATDTVRHNLHTGRV